MRASDPVATMMFFASSDLDAVAGLRPRPCPAPGARVALDPVHLVLLHQELDAFGVLGDDLVLALDDLGIIEARVVAEDACSSACWKSCQTSAVCSSALVGMHPTCRHVPPSFGSFSTSGGLQTVLAGANGGRVSARSAADDDEIVGH